MRALSTIVVAAVCLSVCLGVFAGEAAGPPEPVPYKAIPDPADDAERHITVTAADRGDVWLLTGILNPRNVDIELIRPLKLRYMRGDTWPLWYSPTVRVNPGPEWGDYRDSAAVLGGILDNIIELRKEGMTWQPVLHHKGPFYGWWSIKKAHLEAYYDHIYTIVKYARHMGLPVDYWECYNEPPMLNSDRPETQGLRDGGGYGFQGTEEEFFAAWDVSYKAIRDAYPEARIVGPSYGTANALTMEDFLAHCKAKGQTLDVVSWHPFVWGIEELTQGFRDPGEMVSYDWMHKNIEEVRELVESKYPELSVQEYHIDEWGGSLGELSAGGNIASLYYLDQAGVDRAAKSHATPHGLAELLVGLKTPRHSYWAWVAYARQDGGKRLVTETNDRCVVALASRHDADRTVRAVVGRARRYAKQHDKIPALPPVKTSIDFQGLPLSGKAEVTILHLGPENGPLWEGDLDGRTGKKNMSVANGQLTVVLDRVLEEEVYSITIAPVGTWAEQEAAEKESRRQKELAERQRQLPKKGERQLHEEATALAAKAAEQGVIRVNCGTELSYTDPKGNGWFADRTYSAGDWGLLSLVESGLGAHRGPIAVAGADDQEIYRSERWAASGYKFTVPNGSYLVRLHWAETYGANRKFDVTIEGKVVLKDLNPLAVAGGKNKAFFREFSTQVADGVLDIEFVGVGMINGIEVIRK